MNRQLLKTTTCKLNQHRLWFLYLGIVIVLLSISCGGGGGGGASTAAQDLPDAVVTDLAKAVIDPSISTTQTSLQKFSQDQQSFQDSATDESLVSLRNSFKQLWLDFMELDSLHLKWYRNQVLDWDTFYLFGRLDTEFLENLAKKETLEASDLFPKTSRGFGAIDYLIFGPTQSETITLVQDQQYGERRLALIDFMSTALVKDISEYIDVWGQENSGSLFSEVLQPSGSNLMFEFNNNDDLIGQWVNRSRQMLHEISKYRIQLVIGNNGGGLDLEYGKSFYSRSTTDLLKASLSSFESLWSGSNGNLGIKALLNDSISSSNIESIKTIIVSIDNRLKDMGQFEDVAQQNWNELSELRLDVLSLQAKIETVVSVALSVQLDFSLGDGD